MDTMRMIIVLTILLINVKRYQCDIAVENSTYDEAGILEGEDHDEEMHGDGHLVEAHNTTSLIEEALEEVGHEVCVLQVASFEWEHVQTEMVIATFLFFSGLITICLHHAGFLVNKIPESCLLIVLGTIVGAIFTFGADLSRVPDGLTRLKPELFFLVLLPPIVLEASYSLHNRVFFDNLGSILVYAVVGTVFNCFIIGPTLYGLFHSGVLGLPKISLIHCMLFASIIVAVDPVAVLAIFQEVGVNSVLYFLVFGESLLNDAVTVVLYNTMDALNCMVSNGIEIDAEKYVIAVFKFFTTSLGGIAIGIFYGCITAYLTQYTVETRVVEPLIIFSLAYLSYATSELFSLSGIVGITVCGLMQAQYAFHNISHKSYVTVKYFVRMASSASDSVIFLYLGLNLVRLDHVWHTGFILASVLLTLIIRFVVTYGLTLLLNTNRLRQISKREQFIMAYGGLRGAVAFSLVSLLDGQLEAEVQTAFMTCTLVIVIFTVFVQGGTIKPLVKLLDITTANKDTQLLLFEELNSNMTDHLMAGIEEIVGKHGQAFFYDFLIHIDDQYLKHRLQRNPMRKDEKILKLFEKIALKQHFANLHGTAAAANYIKDSITGMPISEDEKRRLLIRVSEGNMTVDEIEDHKTSLLSHLSVIHPIGGETVGQMGSFATGLLGIEEEGTRHEIKFKPIQGRISNITHSQDLRLILSPPDDRKYSRLPTSNTAMDDRSDILTALQEKARRFVRLQRSRSSLMSAINKRMPGKHKDKELPANNVNDGPSTSRAWPTWRRSSQPPPPSPSPTTQQPSPEDIDKSNNNSEFLEIDSDLDPPSSDSKDIAVYHPQSGTVDFTDFRQGQH